MMICGNWCWAVSKGKSIGSCAHATVSDAVRQGVTETRNSYLMKPFDREYLLLKVRAALKS